MSIDKTKFAKCSDEQLDEAIAERRSQMKQMVGWLYPSILAAEIAELLELKKDPLRGVRAVIEESKLDKAN